MGRSCQSCRCEQRMGYGGVARANDFQQDPGRGSRVALQSQRRSSVASASLSVPRFASYCYSNGPLSLSFLRTDQRLRHHFEGIDYEEFGDGIMSAIDFKMNLGREANPAGDRVTLVM